MKDAVNTALFRPPRVSARLPTGMRQADKS